MPISYWSKKKILIEPPGSLSLKDVGHPLHAVLSWYTVHELD